MWLDDSKLTVNANVCLCELALQQTGDLSRMYFVFYTMTVEITSSPPVTLNGRRGWMGSLFV